MRQEHCAYLPPGPTSTIAWAGIEGQSIQMHIAVNEGDHWRIERPFADIPGDCFRPNLCACNDGVYLVWDCYVDGSYQVVLAKLGRHQWKTLETISVKDERCLCPRVVCRDDGPVFFAWVVLKEVVDKLGIIDHFAFTVVARYKDGKVQILEDASNPLDLRIVADLREGLLASESYKGHLGLRRNPQLSLSARGDLWLFWEMRKETKGPPWVSRLVGRRHVGSGEWTDPAIYCDKGYCYSVAARFDVAAPVCFLDFLGEDYGVVKADFVDLARGEPVVVDNSKRDTRWRMTSVKPEAKPTGKVKLADGEYSVFWADTHCHSNFSADAEGEVDELVHFGRDMAGLDAMTVVDNDYYPHKALTEPEWRLYGQLARHFTRQGEFVLMPGYEFTHHRKDLDPDFNHRCVIYPGQGGMLFRRIDPDTNEDSKMIAELKKTNGMAYPHHCSYELMDGAVEWNIEACSSWRVCLEETTFTVDQLKRGRKIGFVGSSDTHRAVPGLGGARTGLYAKDLTPDALFDAYRNRRCIATQGFNIFVDFRVADTFIGGEVHIGEAPGIRAEIQANDPIDYVEVLRDGESIFWQSPKGQQLSFDFLDDELAEGDHFYYLKVKLVGDPSLNVDADARTNRPVPFSQNSRYPHNLARARGVFAWTSPIWVRMV